MSTPTRRDVIGVGLLSRGSSVVYWFLVIEGMLILTTLPGIVVLPLLDRDASNIPLAALALVPVGPAVAGAVFAWRRFLDDRDLSPAAHFWRGYRLNLADALRVWVPTLAVLTVLGINLAHMGTVGVPGVIGPISVVIAVVVVVLATHALVIVSLFSFRLRDAIRLAGFCIATRPLVSLGVVSLVILAAGVVLYGSDVVFVLLASVFTFLLVRNERKVIADVQGRFVVPEGDVEE